MTETKLQKLVEHARKITSKALAYAYELKEDNLEKAKNSLNYAKQVDKSLAMAMVTEPNTQIEGQSAFMIITVSILPQLENAIAELEEAVANLKIGDEEEDKVTEEQLDKELDNLFDRDLGDAI